VDSSSSKEMEWLICWFRDNTNLERAEIDGKMRENYFEKGWIDSFKFMTLINDMENEFGITFSNDDFQDREFSNIEGLSRIITRLVHHERNKG